MIGLIIFILGLIGGIAILFTIVNHIQNVNRAKNRKIKFSDWSTWYFLNPDVWQLNGAYDGIIRREDINTCYCFNFIDELRFKYFIATIKKENTKKQQNQDIIRLLEKVQEDIKSVREKSNKEISQARSEMDDYCRRSKEEF